MKCSSLFRVTQCLESQRYTNYLHIACFCVPSLVMPDLDLAITTYQSSNNFELDHLPRIRGRRTTPRSSWRWEAGVDCETLYNHPPVSFPGSIAHKWAFKLSTFVYSTYICPSKTLISPPPDYNQVNRYTPNHIHEDPDSLLQRLPRMHIPWHSPLLGWLHPFPRSYHSHSRTSSIDTLASCSTAYLIIRLHTFLGTSRAAFRLVRQMSTSTSTPVTACTGLRNS